MKQRLDHFRLTAVRTARLPYPNNRTSNGLRGLPFQTGTGRRHKTMQELVKLAVIFVNDSGKARSSTFNHYSSQAA
jgi:hypothetical protein